MPDEATFSISVDHLIARIDFHRAPTIADLLDAVQSVTESPLYNASLRLLIVDHGTDFDLHDSQVDELVRRQIPQLKGFRSCAVAVKKDRQFAIGRKVGSHFYDAGIPFGVFKDEVAAGVWLLSAV